jgi:hypothetical protein
MGHGGKLMDNKNLCFLIATVGCASLVGAPALACPLCHTNTAIEVRALLLITFQDLSVLMATTLPFLTIGVIVGVINHPLFSSERIRK